MPEPHRPVFALAGEYVDRLAALDPFAATRMGIPGYDHLVTDYSPEAEAQRTTLMRETLAHLAAIQPADRDDAIAAAVLRDALDAQIESHDAGDDLYNVSARGPLAQMPRMIEAMQRTNAEEVGTITRRLEALPAAIASVQRLAEASLRAGKVSAHRQVEDTLRQLSIYGGDDPETPPAFAGLRAAVAAADFATPALMGDLDRAVAQVRAAFAHARDYFAGRYLDAATDVEASGPERYRRAAHGFLGMQIDLRETYEWGWEEVARLDAEMRATAERVQAGASVDEAVALLDADPARTLVGEEALLIWLAQVETDTLAQLDGVYFDVPEPVRRLEVRIAPPGGSLAQYYTGPSEDFTRPGRTWYPTGGRTTFHRWRDLSIAYHEGVPGHHIQIGTAIFHAERASRFQRLATRYSGTVEGWALYAERLMAELGFMADPGDYMGTLWGQKHRAIRVVVDIGVHAGYAIPAAAAFEPGQPWTYDRMVAFQMQQGHTPRDFAESEAVRYLGWPAQAISYKVGERAWLQIREESKARQGANFSLKAFHNAALPVSRMGLDLLRETMRQEY